MIGSAEPRHEPSPPIPRKKRAVLKLVLVAIIIGASVFVSVNAYINSMNYSINRPDITSATISATCTNCYSVSQYPNRRVTGQFAGELWTTEGEQPVITKFVSGNNTRSWTLARTATNQRWTLGWSFDIKGYDPFNNGTIVMPSGGMLRVIVTLNTGQVVYDQTNLSCLPSLMWPANCWHVIDSWTT